MVEITIMEAIKLLMDSCPGLYAEFVSFLLQKNIASKSFAYVYKDIVLVKTLWCDSDKYIWYLCDTGNADMGEALSALDNYFVDKLDKILIYAKEIDGIHCLVFSRFGATCQDGVVRLLDENDSDQILSLTDTLEDVDFFADSISKGIYTDFLNKDNDPSIQIMGAFDNSILVGAISLKNNGNRVIVIRDLFVMRTYRRRGYANRLIRAALSLYPGVRYFFSCGTDNVASIACAKSAGFIFEGTYRFL